MSVEIIADALKYYDTNHEKFNDIKNKIKYIQLYKKRVSENETEGLRLIFLDIEKNELFVSRIEIFGQYFSSIKTWVWGWSLPQLNKSLTRIIRGVFLYGTDIDINNQANVMLKNELVTSRFQIEDDIQLEMHSAIASYLAKKPFVFVFKNIEEFNLDIPIEIYGEDYEGETTTAYYIYIIDVPEL